MAKVQSLLFRLLQIVLAHAGIESVSIPHASPDQATTRCGTPAGIERLWILVSRAAPSWL